MKHFWPRICEWFCATVTEDFDKLQVYFDRVNDSLSVFGMRFGSSVKYCYQFRLPLHQIVLLEDEGGVK